MTPCRRPNKQASIISPKMDLFHKRPRPHSISEERKIQKKTASIRKCRNKKKNETTLPIRIQKRKKSKHRGKKKTSIVNVSYKASHRRREKSKVRAKWEEKRRKKENSPLLIFSCTSIVKVLRGQCLTRILSEVGRARRTSGKGYGNRALLRACFWKNWVRRWIGEKRNQCSPKLFKDYWGHRKIGSRKSPYNVKPFPLGKDREVWNLAIRSLAWW